MDKRLNEWLHLLLESTPQLDNKQRSVLFAKNAAACVESGVLKMYQELFVECNSDLDLFFETLALKKMGIGRVIVPTSCYELVFERCTCNLVTAGTIRSKAICECSKQSILHVMHSLGSLFSFDVTIERTILRGATECCFRISIIDEDNRTD